MWLTSRSFLDVKLWRQTWRSLWEGDADEALQPSGQSIFRLLLLITFSLRDWHIRGCEGPKTERLPRSSFFFLFFTPLLLGYYISEHVAKRKMVTAQENYKECVHGLWRAVGVDMLKKDLKEAINEFMNLKKRTILEYIWWQSDQSAADGDFC